MWETRSKDRDEERGLEFKSDSGPKSEQEAATAFARGEEKHSPRVRRGGQEEHSERGQEAALENWGGTETGREHSHAGTGRGGEGLFLTEPRHCHPSLASHPSPCPTTVFDTPSESNWKDTKPKTFKATLSQQHLLILWLAGESK